MSTTPKPAPEEVHIIARALDQIADEYDENNKVIFQDESDRARQHFATVHRRIKDWSKSQQCMVPGCGQRSIARSHTVPKTMSLRVIEEGGHVLVPSFDQRLGIPKVERTGLSDATTFPGFCTKHELLFQGFERKGSIETAPEVCLQIYRAACRELFRAKFVVEQHDWTISEYCKTRDKGFVRLIQERARALGLQKEADLSSFRFEHDPLVEGANDHVLPVRELITHFEQRLLPALERAVFHGDDSCISVTATTLDVEIPVALAGSGSFLVAENGAETRVSVLMNVVPQSSSTLIVMATLAVEDRFLEVYKARWMNHALSMLWMIESWMINGTDQWCIRPSTWERIPPARAARLLSEVVGYRRNVGEECDASIFDDIRSEFIRASDVANANSRTSEHIDFIESQQRKMV